MLNKSNSEIAAEFIGYHRMDWNNENILSRQGSEQAGFALTELVYDNPIKFWEIAIIVATSNPNDDALMSIGSKISMLLIEHPQIIDLICKDVHNNPDLRTLMSWIIEDEHIDKKIWLQVETLSKPI